MGTRKQSKGGRREGAGRPAVMVDPVHRMYRLPKATVDRVAQFAADSGDISANEAACLLLESGLRNLKPIARTGRVLVTCTNAECGHQWQAAATTAKPRCGVCQKYVRRTRDV